MVFNYRRLKTCHDARELYVWASTFLSHLKLASQNSNKQFWEISESLHWKMHNFCLLAFPSIVEPVKCSVFTLYVLALGSALVEHLAINMIPSLKIWCAKSLQSCLTLTLWTAAPQASLSMGFLQARILEWVAVPSSRGSSWPRDQTCVSFVFCIGRWVLYH